MNDTTAVTTINTVTPTHRTLTDKFFQKAFALIQDGNMTVKRYGVNDDWGHTEEAQLVQTTGAVRTTVTVTIRQE